MASRLCRACSFGHFRPWGLALPTCRPAKIRGRHSRSKDTMKSFSKIGIVITLLLTSPASASDVSVVVGQFSKSSLTGWETKIFNGETKYTFEPDPISKTVALQAASNASASGRYRKLVVDLTKTPFLNWSWKVLDPLTEVDENSKSGDDFSARLYVVVERGIMGMSSLSVNYVWATMHDVGSAWASPYTSRVRLIALDAKAAGLHSWRSHKRDVRADLREQFGEDIRSIDAIAIMTDTDDSGGHARTLYGDIWFSSQ